MATQTIKGKAFEYSCLKAIKERLEITQQVEIEATAALATAEKFYYSLDVNLINKLNMAADAAINAIMRLEPQLDNPDINRPLFLSIQEDSQGIAGDVRDVLCIRKQNDWEIGLSCKHNHHAVKHSRLSQTIDFGKQWFGKQCSMDYFDEIKPIFNMLSMKKLANEKWNSIPDKKEKIYVPLIDAFIAEIKRLDLLYPGEIPKALLKYLLGENDYYKVITNDTKKITIIQAFNVNGTLNCIAKGIRSETKIGKLKLPTKFFDISYKDGSKNTIIITCDGGWALSFRIHNARTLVEPSLKFDIQLVGVPDSLHKQIEPWIKYV